MMARIGPAIRSAVLRLGGDDTVMHYSRLSGFDSIGPFLERAYFRGWNNDGPAGERSVRDYRPPAKLQKTLGIAR